MLRLVFVLLMSAVFAGCSNINKLLKSSDYELKTRKANEFYDKKKYNEAQMLYEDVLPVLKGSAQYEDVYYRYAYSHYYQKDFLNAEDLFKRYLESFPSSEKSEEIEFMRAYTHYRMSPKPELDQTSTLKAIGLFQTFINTHKPSERTKEAADYIEKLYDKLEAKDFRSALLYYNLGYYLAAATAFNQLMFNHPDSEDSDNYKLQVVKSRYKYAENSVEEKQIERFEAVLNDCADFSDLFPESKHADEVERFRQLATNKIKSLQNEQDQASINR